MAHAFLTALPKFGSSFTSQEFNVAIAYRNGIPIIHDAVKCPARNCTKDMDIHGHHGLRCKANGSITSRHNKVRDLLFSLCQSALLEPRKEPTNLIRNCGLRPADISINYHLGMTWALDNAVVDPLRNDLVHLSCNPDYSHCDEYGVKVKDAKYSELIKKNDLKFSAIIAETLGGWNSKAHEFFSYLARIIADRKVVNNIAVSCQD
jgi:hypothetical protein